jgi:tetratricopeptide (TPR) repeat protein
LSEELGRGYYLLALSAAERSDLSAAVRFAARAVSLGNARDNVRRLMGLCLYELGEMEKAADLLAAFPDLADSARKVCASTRAGLGEVERFARRGRWRAALRAAENIPHQSVRVLKIRGCILAGAGRYAGASRLFASAWEKDGGDHAAAEYLRETARHATSFWGYGK